MINFDEVNFSEHRSEEVMFLLTLSVYSTLPKSKFSWVGLYRVAQ